MTVFQEQCRCGSMVLMGKGNELCHTDNAEPVPTIVGAVFMAFWAK